jgi:hypothetical protein
MAKKRTVVKSRSLQRNNHLVRDYDENFLRRSPWSWMSEIIVGYPVGMRYHA